MSNRWSGLRVAVAGVAVVGAGAGSVASAAGDEPSSIVMDDFESGALTTGGPRVPGRELVRLQRRPTAPDPEQSDPNFPFAMPDPPQGEFAAVTDMTGPGTRILYRDVTLNGELTLHVTVFYEGSAPFSTPDTLAFDAPEPNQQFRIDLVDPWRRSTRWPTATCWRASSAPRLPTRPASSRPT